MLSIVDISVWLVGFMYLQMLNDLTCCHKTLMQQGHMKGIVLSHHLYVHFEILLNTLVDITIWDSHWRETTFAPDEGYFL